MYLLSVLNQCSGQNFLFKDLKSFYLLFETEIKTLKIWSFYNDFNNFCL